METLGCEGVWKSLGSVCVLADVSVRFPSTRITAIIGPNGAGKTTLFNILTGLLPPDEGRCFLGDRETTGIPPHRLARLGVARTFQDLRLVSRISALENTLLVRPNQRGETLLGALFLTGVASEERENMDEAWQLLRSVGLKRHALKQAGSLSYGQQKLLTLVCCIATTAPILLLDEPVAGVDVEMAARILDLIGELRGQGKNIVLIEHDIDAVRKVADHVIVMDEGRIIVQGAPNDVLEQAEIMEAYLG